MCGSIPPGTRVGPNGPGDRGRMLAIKSHKPCAWEGGLPPPAAPRFASTSAGLGATSNWYSIDTLASRTSWFNCHNPTQLNQKLGRPYFPKKTTPQNHTTKPPTVPHLFSSQLNRSPAGYETTGKQGGSIQCDARVSTGLGVHLGQQPTYKIKGHYIHPEDCHTTNHGLKPA